MSPRFGVAYMRQFAILEPCAKSNMGLLVTNRPQGGELFQAVPRQSPHILMGIELGNEVRSYFLATGQL